MIRRSFYFLLVTVILGGLAGGIAWWSFYALPAFIAQSIQSAPAPVQTVSMVLEGRPGELARVGLALSLSGDDLRDLQLRHSVHGGDGLLTLSVRAGEADRLREALEVERFSVVG